MLRCRITITAAVFAAALAVGVPGSADAVPPQRSSGLADEFPVGQCIDTPSDTPLDLVDTDARDLTKAAAVSCTDPTRNYRVVAQVPNPPACGPNTARIFNTRDVVVLCLVNDSPETLMPVPVS